MNHLANPRGIACQDISSAIAKVPRTSLKFVISMQGLDYPFLHLHAAPSLWPGSFWNDSSFLQIGLDVFIVIFPFFIFIISVFFDIVSPTILFQDLIKFIVSFISLKLHFFKIIVLISTTNSKYLN